MLVVGFSNSLSTVVDSVSRIAYLLQNGDAGRKVALSVPMATVLKAWRQHAHRGKEK